MEFFLVKYHHQELTGSKFNSIVGCNDFYKFMNDDLIHNKFQYKLGLNVDNVPFNPSGDCLNGGLSFCDESTCHIFWRSFGKKLAIVKIPNDAHVWIEFDSIKADKIILKNILDFDVLSDNLWIFILQDDYNALEYIKNQTKDICREAIKQNGLALQYIKKQTKKLCVSAIKQNGLALQYVKPDIYIYLNHMIDDLAVKQNGLAIQYVYNQNDDICKSAIINDPLAIQYIKAPTNYLCKLAVKLNGYTLCYIDDQTEEICKIAVQSKGLALEYVKDQTKDICKLAVQQNTDALQYVKDESILVEMCNIAIKQKTNKIRCVKKQTKDMYNHVKNNY